ncbi:MAG: ABC transporter ATP-binding protein [Alphaproteobacteria bacterium]
MTEHKTQILQTPSEKDFAENIVIIQNVVNRFGSHTVHDGLNLQIKHNEIMGVVGGSGTGKSVLLRSILGLHNFNEGRIYFNGKDIKKLNHQQFMQMQQASGVLFQGGALFSSLSVLENVALPIIEHCNISKKAAYSLAKMKIELVGLDKEAQDRLPSELSGGMIKRAGLARALALDPEILFLDEPTAGLDPISAAAFDQLTLELARALGLSVMMITHDLDSLYTICDRIAVLVDKKITVGNLSSLLKEEHPWIKNYFHGERSRNVLEAKA